MKHSAYLLLGSNLGDRLSYIEGAMEHIAALGTIVASSAVYKTEPWEMDSEKWFYNRVVHLHTDFSVEDLLAELLKIENLLGRDRSKEPSGVYSSRTMDIDILYFDDAVWESEYLTIPHPRLHERRFALAPMVELAPSHVHPVLKQTQFELLKACEDQSFLELV